MNFFKRKKQNSKLLILKPKYRSNSHIILKTKALSVFFEFQKPINHSKK